MHRHNNSDGHCRKNLQQESVGSEQNEIIVEAKLIISNILWKTL